MSFNLLTILFEIIHKIKILEPDTYPLTSSLTAPRHLSDLDRTIRKKSDDIMMKYDPDYTSQQDDYDINAGIHDQQQQQQPFQHQQHSAQPPWRFILLNYSNRMPSKKPLKTIENASKYPQTQQTYYNKRIFSNGLNDINNNGHIQLNNHDDYDLFSDQFDLIPSTNFHNNFQYKMNQRTNGMN